MCDRAVHGNNKIEILNKSSGVCKILEVVRPIDNMFAKGAITQLRNAIITFLQTVKFAALDVEQSCKLIKANAAVPIASVGRRLVLPRGAGPR